MWTARNVSERTTERGELEIFYKNQMTTNKHDCGEKMSCHYLNIVIIKMYINNMFCGSLQLIELLSWSEENEAKDNMSLSHNGRVLQQNKTMRVTQEKWLIR